MEGKTNKRKLQIAFLFFLILSVFVGTAAGMQRTLPDNPLQKKADSVLMLQAAGKSVSQKPKTEQPPEEQPPEEEPPEDQKDQNQKDDAKDPNDKENDGEKPSDSSDTGTTPGPGETSLIYFTTSIKDGSIITTNTLQFSMSHQITELTPQGTQIYVNGTLAEDVKDARPSFSVFLREGENTVRVQALYENQNGQVLAPYKDYTIFVDTRTLVIETSLQDGMITESALLQFTAKAMFGQDEVDLTANLNGEELAQFDGVYEGTLEEGANEVVLSAAYRGHEETTTYILYHEPPEGLYIDTDLEDLTVIRAETGDFTFRAEALGGTRRTEFTVSLNGEPISGQHGRYDVLLLPATELSGQNNIIKMIAKDDEQEETLRFRVKFIPIATPETEPAIQHLNISDGMTIKKKNPFTLEIAATDYRGNKIYYDGIEVFLNGKKQIVRETSPYITYKLNFLDGQNTVKLKVTDDDGRFKEFTYIINYEQPDTNEKIGTVRVTVDANVLGIGTIVDTEVDLLAADSAAHVILRAMDKAGIGYRFEGSTESNFYLSHINKPGIGMRYNIPDPLRQAINEEGILWQGREEDPKRALDSLGEFDYTSDSGWLIIVDGAFITESASAIDIADGSVIKVRYTLAKGKDIGGAMQGESFDTIY